MVRPRRRVVPTRRRVASTTCLGILCRPFPPDVAPVSAAVDVVFFAVCQLIKLFRIFAS